MYDLDFSKTIQAAEFYFNEKLEDPVFVGVLEKREDKQYIKILKFIGNHVSFGMQTLYARIKDGFHRSFNCTFFNCCIGQDYINNFKYVEFKYSIITYSLDSEEIDKPIFGNKTETYKFISLRIKNLDDWLWNRDYSLPRDNKFELQFYDKDNNPCRYWDSETRSIDESFDKFIINNSRIDEIITINDTVKIEIHSYPSYIGNNYPDIKIHQDCRIDIFSQEEQKIDFFFDIINHLTEFFTILWNKFCKIDSIRSKSNTIGKSFFSNDVSWDYRLLEKDFFHESLSYQRIKKDLNNAIKSFFKKGISLQLLYSYLSDIEGERYIDSNLVRQIQALETYGNVISKGKNGRNNAEDLKVAIGEISDEAFKEIFLPYDYCSLSLFMIDSSENVDIASLKEKLKIILQEIRNYLIHPYVNGVLKEQGETTKIPQNFLSNDGIWHNENLFLLSARLKIALKWLWLKEVGLEKYHD